MVYNNTTLAGFTGRVASNEHTERNSDLTYNERKASRKMSKKAKQSKHKKKVTISPSQADKLFDLAGEQIFRGNYTEAVAT